LEIHVPIQPQVVFTIGPLVVTNTLLTSWFAEALLILFAVLATRSMRLVPSGLQNFAEGIVEMLLALGQQAAGARARSFLPLVGTLFLYIWFANWLGIFPGIGTIPLLRTPNSDLSITFAMALFTFCWVQVTGIRSSGAKRYLWKFIWPPGLGFLELISEIARPISLALRLFGNILAGFILVEVMLQIVPVGVPAVFLGVELGVGLIQALIFAILTLAFLSLAAAHGHLEDDHAAH
jgi:F-type H+-transporting ATPase subunit a